MGLFSGKKGLILGVLNGSSLSWAGAKFIIAEGGQCGFAYHHDPPCDERLKRRRLLTRLTEKQRQAKILVPIDECNDADVTSVMDKAADEFGKIDFVLHSFSFGPLDDFHTDTIDCSRNGFDVAMERSVYSLIAVAKHCAPVMNDGGSIVTMTHFSGERCFPGCNVISICKSALNCTVKSKADTTSWERRGGCWTRSSRTAEHEPTAPWCYELTKASAGDSSKNMIF